MQGRGAGFGWKQKNRLITVEGISATTPLHDTPFQDRGEF